MFPLITHKAKTSTKVWFLYGFTDLLTACNFQPGTRTAAVVSRDTGMATFVKFRNLTRMWQMYDLIYLSHLVTPGK